MKIGYFINFKWMPARTGAGIHASQLAEKLIERGHSFHKIFYDYQIPVVTEYRRRDFFKFINTIDLLYIRVHEGLSTDKFSLLKLCRFSRLPVVWEINAPLEENFSLGQSKAQITSLQNKRKFLARFVDASISTCDELKDHCANDLGIKNNYSIPLGSDPKRFSPELHNSELYKDDKDSFKIVWAGSAQYTWQALDVVSEIAKKIYAVDKDIKFYIIGKKQDQDLKHLEFDNVRIIDRVTYDEIPPYIASCDMGLCLYNHQANAQFYRSPLKLFDYMACGLPVISTPVGQIKDIVEHDSNGLLVENNDIDVIIKHILDLKKDEERRKRIGYNARKHIEDRYNWTRVAQETEVILENLIHKG